MKTSECLYCGMTTSSGSSICETCDFAVTASQVLDDAVASESNNHHETYVDNFGVQSRTTPEKSEYAFQQTPSQSSGGVYPPRQKRPPRPSAPRSSCVICHRQIPAAQKVCFECAGRKLPVKKFVTAFTVLAVLAVAGIGVFAYKIYLENSPLTVLKKYATVTGSDKMVDLQNLTFKGKVNINVSAAPANRALQSRSIKEFYSFEMILQKPNKFFMVFLKDDPSDASKKEVVFKQGFDGFNGWKYAKMFNQQPTLEDVNADSKGTKPEIFLENYDSVEYLTDEIKAEYGEENLEPLMSITSYNINGISAISRSRVAIQVVKNNQNTLLIFDKESSLLLGMLKKESIKNAPTISRIYVDNYKTLTIKDKNSEDVEVLMPYRWKFEIREEIKKEKFDVGYVDPAKINVSMSMILDIENTETDAAVEDKIFFKPLSIYTAENGGY